MSVSIGLSDSSWQRASSQAFCSVPRLGTVSLSTAAGWVTPLSFLGPAAGSVPVPTTPTALCRVSLSCSDNHKEFFHFVPFLYLKNKQAVHPRGGKLRTTYKLSMCRTHHVSSAFSCQQGCHNVTSGILRLALLCRAKRCSLTRPLGCQEEELRHQWFCSSSRLYRLLEVFWYTEKGSAGFSFTCLALCWQASPMHQYFLLISQVPPGLGAAVCLAVVLCPNIAPTTMSSFSATPLSSGASRIPVMAFTHGPSFSRIF